MSDLKEDLDRALRTVPVSEPPVERAKRDGRRIRTRRRLSVVAGALAVAAIAAGYPALTRTTSAPPVPATGSTPKPSATHDPAVTAYPAPHATQAPDGLTSTDGEVGAGAIGKLKWQATIQKAGTANAEYCFTFTSASAGGAVPECTTPPKLSGSAPGVFDEMGGGATPVATMGEAAADVTYFIVTFRDGQQLKLLPVSVHGHRYFAWAAPVSMAIESVDAHLGGPYATSGLVATAVPFNPQGEMPVFGRWQGAPGLPTVPQVTKVIAGRTAGHAWKVTAYAGPWGICVAGSPGGTVCFPPGRRITNTSIIAGGIGVAEPGPRWGFAVSGTARVRVTLSDGTTVIAQTVTVGNEPLFAFWTDKNVQPTGWTTYDASGKQTGTTMTVSGTATATKSASP